MLFIKSMFSSQVSTIIFHIIFHLKLSFYTHEMSRKRNRLTGDLPDVSNARHLIFTPIREPKLMNGCRPDVHPILWPIIPTLSTSTLIQRLSFLFILSLDLMWHLTISLFSPNSLNVLHTKLQRWLSSVDSNCEISTPYLSSAITLKKLFLHNLF